MDSTEISSCEWTKICRKAFDRCDGLPEGLAAALCGELAARVGNAQGGLAAQAFVEGVTELARYAAESMGESENAVDEESAAVAAARRVMRPAFAAKIQRRLDTLDEQTKGLAAPCAVCGNPTESEGRRVRTWQSLLGPVSLKRRYLSCTSETCEHGDAPSQRALGLPTGEFTGRLEEVCTMMATTVPHGMATTLVEKLCGIDISVKAMQDMTARRGEAVVARQQAESESFTPLDDKGLPVPQQLRPGDALPQSAAPNIAYLEVDGVLPITREELTGKELSADDRRRQRRAREKKARGGKGRRYRIVGREVKNAVLYTGEDCAKESPTRGCILEKTYVSHLGDWLTFAGILWVAMLRQRFDEAKLLVVLSDGAEWIRSLAAWLPIETFLILDLYHVNKRIFEVGRAVFGEASPQAHAWARMQCERVEVGGALEVIQALVFLRPKGADARKLVDDLKDYLKNNRDRMDYPAYKARGLRITSAAVESANFHVTGTRLKLQGMRWSADGAAQMAALRADLFNGVWETRTRQLLAA